MKVDAIGGPAIMSPAQMSRVSGNTSAMQAGAASVKVAQGPSNVPSITSISKAVRGMKLDVKA